VNRHTFLLLHRWLGLLLILPVLLLSVTGGLLVYKQELDAWLNADLMQIEQHDLYDVPLSVHQLEDHILAVYPQARISWFDLSFYKGSGYQQPLAEVSQTAAVFWLSGTNDPQGDYQPPRHNQIFVNPYTGEVLGGRKWGEFSAEQPLQNLMPLLYKLHYSLLAGQDGRKILGWLTLAWLLMIPVGVYLSWPHHARPSRRAESNKENRLRQDLIHWLSFWRYRAGKSRFQQDFFNHRWVGLLFAPVVVIFLLSGVSFNLKPLYYSVFDPLALRQQAHQQIPASLFGRTQPMSLEQAVATGERLTEQWTKDAGFKVIHPVGLSHSGFKGTYLYRSYSSLDYSSDSAKTSVWFDAASGELLARFQATGASGVDSMTIGFAAVHKSGLGWWSKLLSLLMAAASVWLVFAGFRLWRFKRRARRKRGLRPRRG